VEKRFLIITNEIKSEWIKTVKKTVALLGHIEIVSVKVAEAEMAQEHYEMVFIDSAATKNIIPLISRLHAAYPKVPIMVATLTRGWHRAREALRAGAVDYILKSLTSDELAATIKSLLGYEISTKPSVSKRETHFVPKATILFADNDPDFLTTRKEFLEQAGYSVITASDPVEARQKLEIGGIDLAILDIRLKDDDDDRDTSGLMLAKKIAREVPKIILTNFPTFDYVRDALRPQLDGSPVAIDFLSKVEGVTALLTTVEDVLKTVIIRKAKALPLSKVFIVHGHDTETLEQIREFLLGIEIKPIILFEEADQGDTIIEKLERCCREADFAIVLFTPDDFGYSKENLTEVRPRARQNVIFELGFMVARLGRRRVRVLYQHGVEIPTDFMGVLYVEMDTSGKWRANLMRELEDTGIIGKATC